MAVITLPFSTTSTPALAAADYCQGYGSGD